MQIPREQQKLYTGRSQYPKFANKTLINEKPPDNNFCCDHLTFWGDVKGVLTQVVQEARRNGIQHLRSTINRLRDQLSSARYHVEGLNEVMTASAVALAPSLVFEYLDSQYCSNIIYNISETVKKDTSYIFSETLF